MTAPASTISKPCPSTGETAQLASQRGKVLLIVNTASACGFTPQFGGLEKLWQDYRDQRPGDRSGFPSNEFGGQDPGSNDEIASFCQLNYGVSFPMMAKTQVNGAQAHPLVAMAQGAGAGRAGHRGASSGTSPSSSSAATARCASATPRTTRPKSCAPTSRRPWPKEPQHERVPATSSRMPATRS
jgi:glutathione peroxidase-family protein